MYIMAAARGKTYGAMRTRKGYANSCETTAYLRYPKLACLTCKYTHNFGKPPPVTHVHGIAFGQVESFDRGNDISSTSRRLGAL